MTPVGKRRKRKRVDRIGEMKGRLLTWRRRTWWKVAGRWEGSVELSSSFATISSTERSELTRYLSLTRSFPSYLLALENFHIQTTASPFGLRRLLSTFSLNTSLFSSSPKRPSHLSSTTCFSKIKTKTRKK